MKLRQLFNKIKDNTDYYSVEINGEKAIRPFTIIPDVEVEGELTKSNMLKILKDNGIIDNTTINTNEIVNKFLEAALEEQGVDSDSQKSSSAANSNSNEITANNDNTALIPVNNGNFSTYSPAQVNTYNGFSQTAVNTLVPNNVNLSIPPNIPMGYNPNFNPLAVVGVEDRISKNSRIFQDPNKGNSSLTPLKAAEILMKKFPFRNTCGALYFFSDGYYSLLTPEKAYRLMIALGYKEISEKGSMVFMKDVYEILKVDPRISYSEDSNESRYLAFNNCVLDLKLWKMLHNDGSIFVTSKVNCNYCNTELPTPIFDKFIFDCANGDSNKYTLLMEILGYYITSDTAGKCFVVLVGPGDTGKSVFGKFIGSLFNKEAVAALSINDLGKKFDTSALVGRKVNLSMDLSNGLIKNDAVSQLKMLTGDDICKAEPKYVNPFFFKNTCKFLFASNFPVTTMTEDIGFNNRLVAVRMDNVIPRELQNKNLIDQLLAEKEGIIYKALQYYRQYKDRNYIFTEVYESENFNIYESQEDVVKDFFYDCCIFQRGFEMPVSDVYSAYTLYCINLGKAAVSTQGKFTLLFKNLLNEEIIKGNVEFKKIRFGEKSLSGVIGINISFR